MYTSNLSPFVFSFFTPSTVTLVFSLDIFVSVFLTSAIVNNFFNNEVNLNILEELQKVLIVKDAIDKDKNGLLKEKTFMVTGKLNGISRAEVKSLIEENSGTSVSTVTKKLNYLIIGEKPTKKKVDMAKDFKIPILNQSQFLKMLNITS